MSLIINIIDLNYGAIFLVSLTNKDKSLYLSGNMLMANDFIDMLFIRRAYIAELRFMHSWGASMYIIWVCNSRYMKFSLLIFWGSWFIIIIFEFPIICIILIDSFRNNEANSFIIIISYLFIQKAWLVKCSE